MLDSTTKRRIDDLRQQLVGKLPSPSAQIEQITIALIYKFMDDMDKEAIELGGRAKFFSGDYAAFGWDNLFDAKTKGDALVKLYMDAIESMELNPNIPQLFRDIFNNAFLPYRDPETLREFLKMVNEFKYDHSEKLGDAFEYLLSVMGSQGDAGQFRTPRHIIDFVVALINPQKHEVIADPACGTAGFLISSYKHILKTNSSNYEAPRPPSPPVKEGPGVVAPATTPAHTATDSVLDSPIRYKGDQLTADDRKRLVANIKGYDISPDMVRLSLVNLYLHGFPEPHIFEYDTLTSEERWNETYDVVLANPPFMSPKGGIRPHKRFGVQSNRSEVLFVDYIAEHLSRYGRAGIIVPEGIIFQSGTAYKALRKMLVEDSLIGVISLPAGVFQPYSGVKTSILWLDKKRAKQTKHMVFAKVENDGFDLGAQRRASMQNDLPGLLELLRAYEDLLDEKPKLADDGQAFEAAVEAVLAKASGKPLQVNAVLKTKLAKGGDYNLSGERYIVVSQEMSTFPIVELDTVAKLEYGFTDSAKEIGNARFIRITDIDERGKIKDSEEKYIDITYENEKYLLKQDDILVARTGATFGKTAIYNKPYKSIFASFLIRINLEKSKVLPKFYWAFALSDKYWQQANNLVTGGGQPQFNGNALKKIQIPLPPLSVQEEIVAEIEGYQKVIDGARQVVDHYKPHIPIDPEWEVVELGEVFETKSGTTPRRERLKYFENGTIPWVKTLDLNNSSIYSTEEKITELALKETHLSILPKGTVLIAMYGGFNQIGRTGVLEIESTHNQAMTALLPNRKINPYFLNYILVSSRPYWKSVANSTRKDPNITKSDVLGFRLPLPSLAIQQRIVTQIEQEQQLVNANKELIRLFEQKIKDRIARVWGSSASAAPAEEKKETKLKEYEMPEEVRMAAEGAVGYGKQE
jgi:type I restriction enzyme M protein